MKYNNHLNYMKRKRFILKVRIVLVLILVLIIGAGTLFYFKYIKSTNPNTQEKTTSEITSSVIAPSINIFRSPFFQFQADKNWVEIPNESNPNKFVYRSLRENLIEHELTIYIDQVPANLATTHVLAVSPTDSKSRLAIGDISDTCVKIVPSNNPSIYYQAKLLDIQFNCDVTNSVYSVAAGEKGGGTLLSLIRPNGTQAKYTFIYKNLKAESDYVKLSEILSTFQTR